MFIGNVLNFKDVEFKVKNEKELKKILKMVYRIIGFDASNYKSSTLHRRIHKRMFETDCKTYSDYLRLLKKNHGEAQKFIDTLTIKVSDFYRDKFVFDFLKRKVLPKLISNKLKKGETHIRIWSVGCAAGQEPYSVAILFYEALGLRYYGFRVSIMGTDVDKEAIGKAKAGVYGASDVKGLSRRLREEYFVKVRRRGESTKYIVRDFLRIVKFKKHDIIEGKIPKGFDMIFCRNLLIYFTPELQEKINKKLYKALKKDGFLVVGTSEQANYGLFKEFDKKAHVFVKKGDGSA